MSGIAAAWLRWRLSEEEEEAREWADRLASEHRQTLERVGRRLYGLSATLAPGSGQQDAQKKLRAVWEFLEGQKERADKRDRKDETDLWQEIHEQMKVLDERAAFLLDCLADDIIAAETSESRERLHLTLIEHYVNILLARQQIFLAGPQAEGK